MRKKKSEHFKRRMIGMTASQWRWLDQESQRSGTSLSEIVRRAIDHYREREGEKGQKQ